MKLPKSIVIQGRRWWQRTYVNTYHTVTIIVDGVCVYEGGREYGYGDYYVQRAAEWLDTSGIIPPRKKYENGSSDPLWQHCRDLGIALHYSAIDVTRKKDL